MDDENEILLYFYKLKLYLNFQDNKFIFSSKKNISSSYFFYEGKIITVEGYYLKSDMSVQIMKTKLLYLKLKMKC